MLQNVSKYSLEVHPQSVPHRPDLAWAGDDTHEYESFYGVEVYHFHLHPLLPAAIDY